jgi:hypothetical protein
VVVHHERLHAFLQVSGFCGGVHRVVLSMLLMLLPMILPCYRCYRCYRCYCLDTWKELVHRQPTQYLLGSLLYLGRTDPRF